MNKLIIIGNGFDLAHKLPTSYTDLILWLVNRVLEEGRKNPNDQTKLKCPIFEIIRITKDRNWTFKLPDKLIDIDDLIRFKDDGNESYRLKPIGSFGFLIFYDIKNKRWVDIEKAYYEVLKSMNESRLVINLNKSLDFIQRELNKYLSTLIEPEVINELKKLFEEKFGLVKIDGENSIANQVYILNFNYTTTVKNYFEGIKRQDSFYFSEMYCKDNNLIINCIHGLTNDEGNPIIFGYGDETDKHYKDLEDKNENCWLDHMKSFSYLKTYNYQHLFEFLDLDKFEVHVMGHSLGISDRLLFNHIFEHENFEKVQLYFYEWENEETERMENDFYEKTQNLSRHFKSDAKHKMRLKVVRFNESQPLPQLK